MKALEDDEPTMDRIVESSLTFDDKKKATELLNYMLEIEVGSQRYVELKNKIKDMLKSSNSITSQQLAILEQQEKAILSQLNYSHDLDLINIKQRLFGLDADDLVKRSIYERILKLQRLEHTDSEYSSTREWINWALALPYRRMAVPDINVLSLANDQAAKALAINEHCVKVRRVLDSELYGMDRVKEELVQILVNRLQNPTSVGASIALKGPKGVGKSFIGKALAKALNKHYEMIACGGLEDPTLFKGSDTMWVGSGPSILLRTLKRAGVNDPIIQFDEIDKLGDNEKGRAVQHSLLDISDNTTNREFRDAFCQTFHMTLATYGQFTT